MALVASQSRVLAFQRVAGFLVIESFDVPLDQRKVFAIMLGVAAGALLARPWRDVIGRMQASVSCEPGRYFRVALHALQLSLSTELVAFGAVRRSIEGLMRARERSGRNLRSSRVAGQQAEKGYRGSGAKTQTVLLYFSNEPGQLFPQFVASLRS